ncbi:MAG: DUF6070 family protein, partial [Streptococcus salivarius]|nr:DUF6070 family protein [Streptococcus salivarius]
EYEVPEDEFEEVIKTYLPFSNTEIEKGTFYNSDNKTFRYRPRGYMIVNSHMSHIRKLSHMKNYKMEH